MVQYLKIEPIPIAVIGTTIFNLGFNIFHEIITFIIDIYNHLSVSIYGMTKLVIESRPTLSFLKGDR